MKIYPIVIVAMLSFFLLSMNPIFGIEPHENIDDAIEDPYVVHAYFLDDVSLIESITHGLTYEAFDSVEMALEVFSGNLALPRQLNIEIMANELFGQDVRDHYLSFQDIYDRLSFITADQKELVGLIGDIESAGQGNVMWTDLEAANRLVLELEHNVMGLRDDIEGLDGLGYETPISLGNAQLLEGLVGAYKASILELMEDEDLNGSTLSLRHTISDTPEGYRAIFSGIFHFSGNPVSGSNVALHINGDVFYAPTDDDGKFSYAHLVPPDIDYDIISAVAQVSYQGTLYESNSVVVLIEIPTVLSISKDYVLVDDGVEVMISGTLKDAYGNALSDRDITVYLNGIESQTTTSQDGTYGSEFSDILEGSKEYEVYAAYEPDENDPYIQQTSNRLQFSIYLELTKDKGLIDRHLLEFEIGMMVLILVFVVYFAYGRKPKASSAVSEQQREEEGGPQVIDQHTLMREMMVLEKIGNIRESIILSYSRMIEYLSFINLVTLRPSTTHIDIEGQLKRIDGAVADAGSITNTFEVARYSKRDIGVGRRSNFFASIRNLVNRIGGKTR